MGELLISRAGRAETSKLLSTDTWACRPIYRKI